FSAAGILALFVLDPIKELMGQSWIKRTARWYYIILIPLVVVLFLALWRRISEYGITEGRYLGLAIGIWLAVMASYFIFSKTKSIKFVPASLCVLTFTISFGSWGMFAVSERSQIARLQGLLASNEILVDGSVQKAPAVVSAGDITEISSILWYLREVHGYDGIQAWFTESLWTDSDETYRFRDASDVADMMGITFDRYRQGGPGDSYTITVNLKTPITISGYDHLVRATYGRSDAGKTASHLDTSRSVVTTPDLIILRIMSDTVATDSLVMNLHPLLDSLTAAYGTSRGGEIPAEKATLEFASAGIRAQIIVLNMVVQRTNDTTQLAKYDALILYSAGEEKK
ncbi:DUF4153 domain-containing protein, partial [bacterium]|nr:DUF4153 domain-containing protein [bacterium]